MKNSGAKGKKRQGDPAFRNNLIRYRTRARLTQRQLSLLAGLGEDAVGAYESHRAGSPSLRTVRLLAKALGVTAAELIEEG